MNSTNRYLVRRKSLAFAALAAMGMVLLAGAAAAADEAAASGPKKEMGTNVLRLSPLVVSATRIEQSSFDLPVSIDSISKELIQEQQAQVNLSETLSRVPGVVVQNRQNYAQDLQISSRGFGARSTFGVRGIRLIADGIPATMPDGQGQAATFNLSSAQRIEVLRGPFSALYGNSSGGVIQIFTEDGPREPVVTPSLSFGSYASSRSDAKFAGQSGALNYVGDLSRFHTGGYRDHSQAVREHFNGKFSYSPDRDSSLTLVGNLFSQPEVQDPLGLTRAQVQANPRQVDATALSFNTRKEIEQKQAGLVYERRLSAADSVRLMGYYGLRNVIQFQAIATGPQAAATHPGGVINLDRNYGGLDLRWTHKTQVGQGPFAVTAGINYDRMAERRKGYQNFIGATLGVQGALRRDEDNTVTNTDAYAQAEWQFAPRWIASAGLRHSDVKFDSKDFYIVPGNGNDSGSVTHRNTGPVAGLVFHATPAVNVYMSAGRGFETPTFNEIAYKSTSGATTGLNFSLQPSKSTQYELGVKAFVSADTWVTAALFRADTSNEITVLSNVGGRSVFQNVGKTKRQGVELALDGKWGKDFGFYGAYTYLDATYGDSFLTCVGTPCAAPNTPVSAGSKIPGVPRSVLYGEVSWKHPASGFSTAVEARWNDKVYVNDTNSEFAGSYGVANWRAGFEQKAGAWRIKEFLRIDNLFDKQYVGSVIVNEGNGRFYEPAPGRSYLLGVTASYQY